jgi:hypothetical protein
MINTYQYTRCTHDDILAAVKWASERLQLHSWLIEVETVDGTDVSNLGHANIFDSLEACVFIYLDKCKEDNTNALSVAIHEVVHIALRQHLGPDEEDVTLVLEPLLFELYMRELGKKMPKKRTPLKDCKALKYRSRK